MKTTRTATIHYREKGETSGESTMTVPANYRHTCSGCNGSGKVYFSADDTDPIPCSCDGDHADEVVRELTRSGAVVLRVSHQTTEVNEAPVAKSSPRPLKYRYGAHYRRRNWA